MTREQMQPVSILPACDSDEAFCEHHEFQMNEVTPIVKRSGAAYTTKDKFSVYYCPGCLTEVPIEISDDSSSDITGDMVYKYYVTEFFDMWDEGDAPGDWFTYFGEVEELENGHPVIIPNND